MHATWWGRGTSPKATEGMTQTESSLRPKYFALQYRGAGGLNFVGQKQKPLSLWAVYSRYSATTVVVVVVVVVVAVAVVVVVVSVVVVVRLLLLLLSDKC